MIWRADKRASILQGQRNALAYTLIHRLSLLKALAGEVGESPATLALSFALANPAVTSVLFGATSPAQIAENVRALDLDQELIERVRALAV